MSVSGELHVAASRLRRRDDEGHDDQRQGLCVEGVDDGAENRTIGNAKGLTKAMMNRNR